MQIRIFRGFTLARALKSTGVDIDKLTHNQLRSLIYAQCNSTYVVPRDIEMKSTGLFLPWQKGPLGKIGAESIIEVLGSHYREWTHYVTGLELPFVRHPEFELFSTAFAHLTSV